MPTLDQLIDDVIWDLELAAYRREFVTTACIHCNRKLRRHPTDTRPLCARCSEIPGHTAEERLIRAIFGEPDSCKRCK